MKPPLLVVDTRGELTIFSSPDTASGWMEALDVRVGEYKLFYCAGVEYSLSAETDNSPVVVGDPIGGEPNFDLVRDITSRLLDSLPTKGRAPSPQIVLSTAEDVCGALAPYAE